MTKNPLMGYAKETISIIGSEVRQARKMYSDYWNVETKRIRKIYGDLFLAPFGIDTDFLVRFVKE